MTNQLPNGWLRQQTETVFEQVSTNTKKINTKNCLATGKFPVIDQGQDFIAGFVNDESKVIRSEKPLIIFGDHTRVVKWIDKAFVPGADGTKILITKSFIESRFFYYQLKSINITDKGYARHFKELKESIFLIPPLAEQKEIATLLDNLLAQVDTLKTRLDAIPNILKRFRQSVLAAAVSGKLTEECREENSTTKKWKKTILQNITDFQNGYAFKSDWFKTCGNYQVVKLANVKDANLKLDASPSFLSLEIAKNHLNFSPNKGDILISMTGTRHKEDYGFVCMVANQRNILINQRVGRFIPKTEFIYNKFLLIYLRSEEFRKQFFKGETGGVNQGNVGSKHIQNCICPLPDFNEQEEIVRRVEELFAFADQIEQRVKVAQQRVNYLTQAILAKAFRGELTADWREQNPDLISGENSAAALLARIQAERKKSAS